MTASNGGDLYSPPLSRTRTQLQIDTQLGGRTDDGRIIQCMVPVEEPEAAYPVSPVLCDSPLQGLMCDGWCQYNTIAHPKVVSAIQKIIPFWLRGEMTTRNFLRKTKISLSACSDQQHAWDGPNGSLTTVLCKYLSKPYPHSFQCGLASCLTLW
ncbi:hypothetical protein V8E53_005861 [Lactarius tabidus]